MNKLRNCVNGVEHFFGFVQTRVFCSQKCEAFQQNERAPPKTRALMINPILCSYFFIRHFFEKPTAKDNSQNNYCSVGDGTGVKHAVNSKNQR